MAYNHILICGLRNTGKTTLFWNLQKNLNWPTFSVSQFLRDYIRINGLQKASQEVLAEHEIKMGQEIALRVENLISIDNNVIIETRIFENIYKSFPDTLKVHLVATDQKRIVRNAFREGITEDKSSQRLINKENQWLLKMQDQFKRSDFFDPKYFDLNIDTSDKSPQQVMDLVIQRLQL